MDADQPLKLLFALRASELTALTDPGRSVRVLRAGPVELPAAGRSVDFVLELQAGADRYVRHLEFQMRGTRDLALRVFEYAARLVARYRRPVLSTVLFLRPPAPSVLSYRETIGRRVVHERRFEVIRLWEVGASRLMALGPGGAALVGLARDGDLAAIAAAARRIDRPAPPAERKELLAILQVLSEGRYTATTLMRVIPKEVVMASSLFAEAERKGRAEGRTEGRTQGRTEAARELCLKLVGEIHPRTVQRLRQTIEACPDAERLAEWALAAHRLSDDELRALILGRRKPMPPTRQGRTPRPARRRRTASRRG